MGVCLVQVLSRLGGGITNATQVPTQCMSLAASWVDSPADMDSQLYCAWRKAGCAVASPGHNPSGSIRSLYLHHAASCCMASYFMPHASCFMPHASCLVPRASRPMPHASCLMPHASFTARLKISLDIMERDWHNLSQLGQDKDNF